MRELLEAVAAGEISPAEAESRLAGYATSEAGRFDATREQRSGIPEAIFGEGKTTSEIIDLAETAIETTGRAIVTRLESNRQESVAERLQQLSASDTVEVHSRAKIIVAKANSYNRPNEGGEVAVVTGGTVDIAAAREAAIIAREMGATVHEITDVGVAGIARLIDQLDVIRQSDVVVVAAGREGALPTVVAGLVDVPVIGVPVSSGYGKGGAGEAALLGMLQSCTVLSVVNIDAGFVAGAQAGLIAKTASK